jgi:hypothetical protein
MPISRNNSNFLFCPQLSSLFSPLRQVALPAQKFVDERPPLEGSAQVTLWILASHFSKFRTLNRVMTRANQFENGLKTHTHSSPKIADSSHPVNRVLPVSLFFRVLTMKYFAQIALTEERGLPRKKEYFGTVSTRVFCSRF